MVRSSRFSPEVRDRAVRMVLEQQEKHESQWSAITFDRREDRLYRGDAPEVGAPGRA
jgi:transposase-like protein